MAVQQGGTTVITNSGTIAWSKITGEPVFIDGVSATADVYSGSGSFVAGGTPYLQVVSTNNLRLVRPFTRSNCNCNCQCDCK